MYRHAQRQETMMERGLIGSGKIKYLIPIQNVIESNTGKPALCISFSVMMTRLFAIIPGLTKKVKS